MGCKKQGAKKQGLDFFCNSEKEEAGLFFFQLQIVSRKNMIQTLKKIGLMQPYKLQTLKKYQVNLKN